MQIFSWTPVATVLNDLRSVDVERPQNEKVEDMACQEPHDYEQAESDVTNQLELQILHHFRKLGSSAPVYWWRYSDSYRKQNVHNVHQTHDRVANPSLMVAITREYQRRGYHMMGEHLRVIRPPLLNVDHDHLLQPERELHQIVPLEQAIQFSSRPICPQVAQVEPVIGIVHEVLIGCQSATGIFIQGSAPYHAKRPECSIIKENPSLLCKPDLLFLLLYTRHECQWLQDIIHYRRS